MVGKRTGRKPKVIDMREAVRLDALSVPRAQIARLMGVSPDTLRKRLKEVEGTPLSALNRGSVLVNDVDARDC